MYYGNNANIPPMPFQQPAYMGKRGEIHLPSRRHAQIPPVPFRHPVAQRGQTALPVRKNYSGYGGTGSAGSAGVGLLFGALFVVFGLPLIFSTVEVPKD